ncbi:hypothetical protein SSPO_097120 [Streptomyces antimycoticus]|uniref:FAD/NAD(P)-binding domain-containing protein n=1 Tax=Streptomyces antimycoticus TaxID=68175 RepID=A0A499UYD0_9ACTN|nr:hypothetical protein SSPO_097120 [Streptomyces antimycoticus]
MGQLRCADGLMDRLGGTHRGLAVRGLGDVEPDRQRGLRIARGQLGGGLRRAGRRHDLIAVGQDVFGEGLTQSTGGAGDEPEAVPAHRDRMSAGWKDDGQVEWVKSAGIDLLRGHGRLAGECEVSVETPDGDTVRLRARHAVAMCTGSRAALPPLPGIEILRPWTSREATSVQRLPQRLMIVGAGVVGVEMATAWQALGSRVTLLAREDGLSPRMEPFAGELVTERLREAGADVRFNVSVVGAERVGGDGHRGVRVTLSDGGVVTADEILFATGRAPRSEDIGLDTVGLKPGDWLATDDSLTVTAVRGTGCTPWATSIAAPSSPARASTRPASPGP